MSPRSPAAAPPVPASSIGLTLYFSPLACSLASRIACYEAGADVAFVEVDTRAKRLLSGGDFRAVHPMGQVPVLDDGSLRLTENVAILTHLVDRFPDAALGPRDAAGRTQLLRWLAFTATELHKTVFTPLLDRAADPAVHAYARARAAPRLTTLDLHLASRPFLLDGWSVADAYAWTVLGWAPHVGLDLAPWPAIGSWLDRVHARPAVARALADERALFEAKVRRAA